MAGQTCATNELRESNELGFAYFANTTVTGIARLEAMSQNSTVDSAENLPLLETWRGAACSAWRRPRRLWEPQATPLRLNRAKGFFSGINSHNVK